KYGNTKLVAEEVVKGIEDVGGIETAIGYVKEVDLERAPGLSIKVQGMKGPLAERELPKCREFGRRIASHLKA
ncbi:MAG: hypothetical protein QUS09_01040, partial [Methanotrichaceae archaeon]|nr:hypothetical protein [Methanotrichaceae archaeon]